MRPNNSNKRQRGRNRSKSSNPLARSYESNGPDVKIRGSALQVADKYAQLARDAQSAGDRVMAENYFQHAEHYYRIVAQAYEQTGQSPRERREDRDEYGRDEQPDITPRGGDERETVGEAQPLNGHETMDTDTGLMRTLRANGNGEERAADDDSNVATVTVAAAAPVEETPDSAKVEETPVEEAEEPKPKPKRRTRTPRTRRASADATTGSSEPAS